MSTCAKIFQKEVYSLTLDDLTTFFATPQQENSYLEFKSGEVSLEKIYREVSAFLNTDGGLLIIGAPEETTLGKEKICTGSLTPCTSILSQDKLIQSIAGNISPSPTGIRVQSLDCGQGKVFVLDIPQSFNPPHQVNITGIYYVRLEREAKPAPHGFVEALFNQRRRSDLRVECYLTNKAEDLKTILHISVKNASLVPTERMGYLLQIDGAKSITRSENLGHKLVAIDDRADDQEVNVALLVKGMQFVYEVHCRLRQPFIYCRYTYYSNDSAMEFVEFIYDTANKVYLHGINTKYPLDHKIPVLEDPKGWIKQERRRHMANLLNLNPDVATDPVIVERLNDMEDTLDVRLPGSLRMFYGLVGVEGYTGTLGAHALQVFKLSSLEFPLDHDPYRDESNYRHFGYIDNTYPLYLCIDNPKNIFFLWEESIEIARGQPPSITHCLLDVLEDWGRAIER